LPPRGQIAPPPGKRADKFNTPYGIITVYVPANMSPDDSLASFNSHVMPQLAQEREDRRDAATTESAKREDLPFIAPGIGKVTIPGSQVVAAGDALNNLKQRLKQLTGQGSAEQEKSQAYNDAEMARLYRIHPEARIGQAVGAAAPMMALSAAAPMAAGAAGFPLAARFLAGGMGPGANIANAAVQGGGMGALQYVEPGGSTLSNIMKGAAAAAVLQTPFSAAQKFAMGPTNQLTPPQASAVADMKTIPGYQPLPSQATGNPNLALLEKVGAYIPGAAGPLSQLKTENQNAVNQSTLRILGAPAESYGTQDVLSALKKRSTDVMNEVSKSDAKVILSPERMTELQQIRENALKGNSPNPKLIGTLNKMIDDSSSELRPEIAALGEDAQAQAIASLGMAAFKAGKPSLHPDGMPTPFFNSVLHDLSELSKNKEHLAGATNAVLLNAAEESLPNMMGSRLKTARQQFEALMKADSAIDPATGNVDVRRLLGNMSQGGHDEARYGGTTNPMVEELSDFARSARGVPPPPAAGSDTANKLYLQRLFGTALAGAGGLAAGKFGGMDAMNAILAALGTYGVGSAATRAYLSKPALEYMQRGMPTLADIMRQGAPVGAAAVPAFGAAYSGQP
jgi:hypothetical protein